MLESAKEIPGVGKASSSRRKPRASSLVQNDKIAQKHGAFLRALRKRAGLTAEVLAEELGFKRPTQVIRREAGAIGIPLSDIPAVAEMLRCDAKLLQFARIVSFETPLFKTFGNALSKEMGASNCINPIEFFDQEIAALEKDDTGGIWRGAISPPDI